MSFLCKFIQRFRLSAADDCQSRPRVRRPTRSREWWHFSEGRPTSLGKQISIVSCRRFCVATNCSLVLHVPNICSRTETLFCRSAIHLGNNIRWLDTALCLALSPTAEFDTRQLDGAYEMPLNVRRALMASICRENFLSAIRDIISRVHAAFSRPFSPAFLGRRSKRLVCSSRSPLSFRHFARFRESFFLPQAEKRLWLAVSAGRAPPITARTNFTCVSVLTF